VKTIVVASANPVKLQATLRGFQRMFPDEQFRLRAVAVPSGVGDQPGSDVETLRGALNRAANAAAAAPEGDYWAGIEGGVEEREGEMAGYAWIVVRGQGMTGKGRTGTFFLPRRVAELVRQGRELGDADDEVFGRSNSKQQNGAVGILTGNVIDRAELYEQAVVLALIPFKNPQLY
jgi:inosine/xanthosine triphosphatase